MKNPDSADQLLMFEAAPAKINLLLRVTGRRGDGYHDLHSLVAFADIGDGLHYDPDGVTGVTIRGPFAAGLQPDDPTNTVWRAASRLAQQAGIVWRGSLILTKNLPVASGIGGGSADAAAAIRLLRRAWQLEQAPIDWLALARELGADVPVCLAGQTAIMTGIGDCLTPLSGLLDWPVMLVNPGQAVSTPAVFAAFNGRFSSPPAHDSAMPLLPEQQKSWLATMLHNDLTAAAVSVVPEIAAIVRKLRQSSPVFAAGMSGSGATCFALAEDKKALDQLARAWQCDHPAHWVATGHLIRAG